MYIKYFILVVPLAFLFHFVEINLSAVFAFPIVLFLVFITAYLTQTVQKRYILCLTLVSTGFSVLFAKLFIVAPNPSWFNPFTMEMAMIFTQIVLLLLILAGRSLLKRLSLIGNS